MVARQIFHHLSTGGEVETGLNLDRTSHLPTKMALVHVDKEVVLFLVSSHVDETDPANVTPIGI